MRSPNIPRAVSASTSRPKLADSESLGTRPTRTINTSVPSAAANRIASCVASTRRSKSSGDVVSAARRKRDGRNAQAPIIQQLVKFSQSGLRHVGRSQFGAGIDLHAGRPEPRGRRQRLPNRLPKTSSLNSDFNGWHGRSGERGAGIRELENILPNAMGCLSSLPLKLRYIFAMSFTQSEIRNPKSEIGLRSLLAALFVAALIVLASGRASDAQQLRHRIRLPLHVRR